MLFCCCLSPRWGEIDSSRGRRRGDSAIKTERCSTTVCKYTCVRVLACIWMCESRPAWSVTVGTTMSTLSRSSGRTTSIDYPITGWHISTLGITARSQHCLPGWRLGNSLCVQAGKGVFGQEPCLKKRPFSWLLHHRFMTSSCWMRGFWRSRCFYLLICINSMWVRGNTCPHVLQFWYQQACPHAVWWLLGSSPAGWSVLGHKVQRVLLKRLMKCWHTLNAGRHGLTRSD